MRTNYDKYREMMKKCDVFVNSMKKGFECLGLPFVAVSDEEKGLYFIDFEYKAYGQYRRIYQTASESTIIGFLEKAGKGVIED